MPDAHPWYITTPIYYVNDRPHIGHCYTSVLADVMARYQRLLRGSGENVFFLTGTDEHADKVVTSAAAHGHSPQQWSDINAQSFRDAFEAMGCTNDDFIRTTEPRHKDKVPGYIRRLMDSGDIYKGEYTGWYDEGEEEYVPENAAREAEYKSRISGRPLVKRSEQCYFFALSKYQGRLLSHIESNPKFILPDARQSEVLGRLRLGLHDVPVSRPVTEDPATQWGIRVPGDPAHRIYVWIDALFNYFTAVDTPERRKFWPARVHLIGKDILWFHAVIWPALLMALGEDIPRTIFGHGWWISDGKKMAKSLGNFIDLERLKTYSDRYSLDALRWFLATQGPMSGGDADFSHARFLDVYNSELANGIGNAASRVGNMIVKYFDGRVPEHNGAMSLDDYDWANIAATHVRCAREHAELFNLAESLGQGIALVREVDGYINKTEPFRLAKKIEDAGVRERLGVILYHCAEALRVASLILSPAMPSKMPDLWTNWGWSPTPGVGLPVLAEFGGAHSLRPGTQIRKGDALFMRADE